MLELLLFSLMESTKPAVIVFRHSHPDLNHLSAPSWPVCWKMQSNIVDLLFIRRWVPGSSQTEDEAFILELR